MEPITIILNAAAIVLLIVLLIVMLRRERGGGTSKDEIKAIVREENGFSGSDIKDSIDRSTQRQLDLMSQNQTAQREVLDGLQSAVRRSQQENSEFITKQLADILKFQSEQNQNTEKFLTEHFKTITASNSEQQQRLMQTLSENLEKIRKSNEEKLDKIQGVVDEKLDKTLNERLDSNFQQIGEQLGNLYKSLGELNTLTTEVTGLNKTLQNVKTRGTWGEMQLRSILEQTMTTAQYDVNVPTKKNSNDRVEFAIKIPSRDDDGSFVYLPIDSKMPSDIYNRIADAAAASDQAALAAACKELGRRIKDEAKTIRDKYIDPPNTTDFAVMFLPTESLYAEVLRIDGLAELCQREYNIMISGPTTITALLNSLRIGFSNMALAKKSGDVLKILQAIKAQYSTFGKLIDKTQKKLNDAMKSTDDLKKRSDMIQRKMSSVEQIDIAESNNLLGIEESVEVE